MVIDKEFYQNLAINEAWKYQGLTYPNPAVGCTVLGKNGEILAVAAHQKAGLSHAELNAAAQALQKLNPKFDFPQEPNELYEFILKNHNNLLKDSTFFVTLEPCSHQGKTPSCAKLLSALHVKKVYIGSLDESKNASGGVEILKNANIEVEIGTCKKKCEELIEPFLLWQKSKFTFFKLALRLDGSYNNGEITSLKSRTFMHDLRDKCELLVIGGESVRVDKPTLDARLVNGNAPDIHILSNSKNFDKSIPLFNVKNREVFISNNKEFPKKYKNIMIEGGSNFLNFLKDEIDWLLIFHGSSFSTNGSSYIKSDLNLKLLHVNRIDNEYISWHKIV